MNTVEGHSLDAKILTLLETGESAVFAARPSYATIRPGDNWDGVTLMLTNRRMLISKDRLFGKPRADFAVEWTEVSQVAGALWNGGGPKIQLLILNSRTREPVELIVAPDHAVDVESAIRSCYLAVRS